MNPLSPSLSNSFPAIDGAKPDAIDASVRSCGIVRYSSQAIFAGANEVEIEHKGALYRLRLTSLGKLILTK